MKLWRSIPHMVSSVLQYYSNLSVYFNCVYYCCIWFMYFPRTVWHSCIDCLVEALNFAKNQYTAKTSDLFCLGIECELSSNSTPSEFIIVKEMWTPAWCQLVVVMAPTKPNSKNSIERLLHANLSINLFCIV